VIISGLLHDIVEDIPSFIKAEIAEKVAELNRHLKELFNENIDSFCNAISSLLMYYMSNQQNLSEADKKEINKQLAIEVSVNEISFSVFENFPQASVSISGIQTKGGKSKNADPLLKAKKLSVLFNVKDIISGNYNIEKILLKDAFLNIVVFDDGSDNFTILKSSDTENESNIKIDLNIINIP
jgi:hypothetical protein